MQLPKWQFASTGGGMVDGVSNPELEYFEGDYNYFLAREILQNALDAKLNPVEPVRVLFSLEKYSKAMFPGYDDFLKTLVNASAYWPQDNLKAQEFLSRGIECMKSDEIDVLKISDFNTKGLEGTDSDMMGSWFGLVKSVGSSNKVSGQGGSFGIGKGAPFAASHLRTCFYSSINELGQNVFQGVCKIVSHIDEHEEVKRGYGSFGLNNQSSIRDRRLLDEHMVRKKRGLDIFVMGYKVEDNWQEKLLESVLRNFWPAIYFNELQVEIDGETLNTRNLEEKLTKYFINKPAKGNHKPEGNPLEYFKAFRTSDIKFPGELPILRNVDFYFRKSENHLNRVAMIRSSKMIIYAQKFTFSSNYCGVFICDNEIGNRELRKMESPQHDNWDPDKYKEKGVDIKNEIKTFIRGKLNLLTRIPDSEITEVPGLHKYLPFDEDKSSLNQSSTGAGLNYTENESDIESGKEIGVTEEFNHDIIINPYKVTVLNKPTQSLGSGASIEPTGRKLKKRKRSKSGNENNDGDSGFLNENLTSRIFITNSTNNNLEYRIILKSHIKGTCNLKILAVGEEGSNKVKIKNVNDLAGNSYLAKGFRVSKIPLNSELATELIIRIEGSIKLSLKIEAYDLQQ